MINCLLIFTTILGHFLYVYLTGRNRMSLALLCKTVAAVCFVMIGQINLQIPPEKFKTWFLYALIFDAIGDVFLGLRNLRLFANSKMFELGTMSFLIGHLLFLNGLLPQVNYLLCICITAILICIYFIFYLNKLNIKEIKKIVIVIYVFSILLIAISGIQYYINVNGKMPLIRMIGSIMFVCSDLILIDNSFREKLEIKHYVYSALYFMAQILIGLSLG